jgi:hypothetical protein
MPRARTAPVPSAAPAWRPEVHPALADAALIDGPSAALAAGMSVSRWRELVAAGVAPRAVVQRPRFSRWKVGDVKAFLEGVARGEVAL